MPARSQESVKGRAHPPPGGSAAPIPDPATQGEAVHPPALQRDILLVLGTHRSGTSVLTECLAAAGLRLPHDRSGPMPDNLRGHFEPMAVVAAQERLMLRAGAHWARLSPMAEDELEGAAWDRAGDDLLLALRQSFGAARRIVVKDPRIATVAPVWHRLAARPGLRLRAVMALRDPYAVAASLARRDGLGPDHALALWTSQVLAQIGLMARVPTVVLPFPGWAGDDGKALSAVGRLLMLDQAAVRRMAARAGAAFDPRELHAEGPPPARPSPIGRIALDLHALALAAAPDGIAGKNETDAHPAVRIDPQAVAAIAARFSQATALAAVVETLSGRQLRHALFGDTVPGSPHGFAAAEAWQARSADADRIAGLVQSATLAKGATRRTERLLARTERQRDRLQADLDDTASGAAALTAQIAATEGQRDALSAALTAAHDGAAALTAQVAATEAQRDALSAALTAAHDGAAALTAQVAATEAQRDALSHLLTGARDAAAAAEMRFAADLDAVRVRAEAADRQLAQTRQALDRMTEFHRKERLTVLKPIYRNLYRLAGPALRRRLPDRLVEQLKRLLPHPDGIPVPLAFGPVPGPAAGFAPFGNGGDAGGNKAAAPGPDAPAVPPPRDGKADIFMFSIIDWAFRTQRPQHLARAFADRGHRVFYIEMEREAGPSRIGAVAPGVWAARLATTPGGPIPTYNGQAGPDAVRHWLGAFAAFCDRVGATPLRHAIVQHPYWWQFLRHTSPDTRITFDCMDEISGFSNTLPHVLAAEADLIAKADRMVVSSAWLAEKHGGTRAVTLVRNAADVGHFLNAAADRPITGTKHDEEPGDETGGTATGVCIAGSLRARALAGPQATEVRPAAASPASGVGGHVMDVPDVPEADTSFEEMAGRADGGGFAAILPCRPIAVAHQTRGADPRPDPPSVPQRFLPPRFLPPRTEPGTLRVGYVGAIAEWFDTDLLEGVAQALPAAEFHLCGAVTATAPLRLAALPNVTLHGEIAYSDVPGFVTAMDVMTIPFRLDPIIRACDPVKFYEHSAAGRPTVATAIPELERAGDLVFRAGEVAEFARDIAAAARAGRDAGFRGRLQDYARDNSWGVRADRFLEAMTGGPRVSVVVLSWGAPDLTLATLHSLVGRGAVWPDLEVVVADNGSPPGALAAIRDYAARHPLVRLVENGANLGFAGGNNAGIRAATGDYVMLLNNDTFVAPGAIAAMVAALERDPGLGVVGPLTNNIGNEARIAVEYTDMDAMIRAARRIAEGHRGQVTEVAVCAYFCAMFRRADLARIGPLSEDYGRGMFEDDDHCARFRAAGLRCGIAEDAFVHHHLSASFGTLPDAERAALFARNRAIFEARWGAWQPHRYRTARPPDTIDGDAGRNPAAPPERANAGGADAFAPARTEAA